jgi:hypothetical protein
VVAPTKSLEMTVWTRVAPPQTFDGIFIRWRQGHNAHDCTKTYDSLSDDDLMFQLSHLAPELALDFVGKRGPLLG